MTVVDTSTGEVVTIGEPNLLAKYTDPTGLHLPDDLDFDDWVNVGHVLSQIDRGVQWWIGDWWRYGEHAYGERASQALDSERWSFGTFANAGWVAGRIETSRRREVLSFAHHQEVAPLDPGEQDVVLDLAISNQWSRDNVRAEVRRRRTARKIGKFASEAPALAARGRYQVLYVDPPWRYEHAEPTRAVENNYPTMALDEIKDLAVPAADNAVMFMWATSPKLAESFEVLDAWAFSYRTCMVWVKANEDTGAQHIGMGYYARQQHELLLIAKRGDLPVPSEENRPASVVVAPRTLHSAKPPEFYELIDRMYPGLAKVELFARQTRDGWAAWGNQVEVTA